MLIALALGPHADPGLLSTSSSLFIPSGRAKLMRGVEWELRPSEKPKQVNRTYKVARSCTQLTHVFPLACVIFTR